MFIIPAWAALNETARQPAISQGRRVNARLSATWWCVFVVLTMLVGWRYQVGGDWFNYIENFENIVFAEQVGFWTLADPGYRLFEFLSWKFELGVYGVNLMTGGIFSLGLVIFCVNCPRPWLALTVAVPYMVLVLGMGYSRQGAALGLVMIGLQQATTRRFMFFVVLGALFHKSAILVLPLAALASTQNRFLAVLWVAGVAFLSYFVLLADAVDGLVKNYIEDAYQSEGALVRLLMNAVPALILLRWRKLFTFNTGQDKLWFGLAAIALVLTVLFFLTAASTALDRVALFVLPLQLLVFSYLPEVMGRPKRANTGWLLLVLLYYGTVMFVWLNFAAHSMFWIPYRFYPFE